MKKGVLLILELILILCMVFSGGEKEALKGGNVELNILMEDVPETHIIKELLPDFEAKTGIKVNFEIVQYTDMHTKLITQLLAPTSAYDVLTIDNYWAGEFPSAGWLEPLESYVKKDNFDLDNYIPSMLEMMGYFNGELYMIPMYNYVMGLMYRKDVLDDSILQEKYFKKTGKNLTVPETIEEYVDLCIFIQENSDFIGSAMQGGKGDPIAMEWCNYYFGLGGSFYDANWKSVINNPIAYKAMELYVKNLSKGAPAGASSYTLEDSLRLVQSGKAFSFISYNWMIPQFQDKTKSNVVDKMELLPIPGEKALAGGWAWGIAKNSKNKDSAWEFIKWVESFEVAKKRALLGGAPTRYDVLNDREVINKFPYLEVVMSILENSKPVPEFAFSTQMVESLGRELSLVVSSGKNIVEAFTQLDKDFNELAIKAGLQK